MASPLEDLLDRAHGALLRGDLAVLSTLSADIEALTADPPRDVALLHRLRAKAERNARLLLAAGRGVRAAKGRLADIAAGPILTTYDARGRRATFLAAADIATRRF